MGHSACLAAAESRAGALEGTFKVTFKKEDFSQFGMRSEWGFAGQDFDAAAYDTLVRDQEQAGCIAGEGAGECAVDALPEIGPLFPIGKIKAP